MPPLPPSSPLPPPRAAGRWFPHGLAVAAASPRADTADRARWLSPARASVTALVAATLAVLVLALAAAAPAAAQRPDTYVFERREMVESQIVRRGIRDPGVLAAMERVPRHAFVPDESRGAAYRDAPVTIAPGQTLSQAYLSALMISLLDLDRDDRVLEVGTGSGYDAAVLAEIAAQVYTIEIDAELAERARRTLRELGVGNVEVRTGDGYRGWPEKAPFDAILLTTAPDRLPEPLFEQLAVGGRLVVAVGGFVQDLQVITKTAGGGRRVKRISPVVLGPMSGEVRDNRR